MHLIRSATEAEMVAAFLKAELHSARFGPWLAGLLGRFGLSRATLTTPDVEDAEENERRARLLDEARGWRRGALLFRGWPSGVTWSLITIEREDVPRLRYAAMREWTVLSLGTRLPKVVAERIRTGDPTVPEDEKVKSIIAVAAAIRAGATYPPAITVGSPTKERIVLVEGHVRVTAHLLAGFPSPFPVIYGAAPLTQLVSWVLYPVDDF